MRRRPLCAAGMVFYLALFFLLTMWPLPVYNDSTFDGQTVFLTGKVSQKESRNGNYQIYLKSACYSDSTNSNEQNNIIKSGVLLYLSSEYDSEEKLPLHGSMVRVKGKKQLFDTASNPGQFDTAHYYAAKGIDYCLKNAVILAESSSHDSFSEGLYVMKQRLAGIFLQTMEEEDAGILSAVILGEKNLLAPEIKELYRNSGAGHLLVVSGLHISLAGGTLLKCLRRLGVPIAISAAVSALFVCGYAALTGMGTSAQRALLMFLIALAGECLGRAYDLLTALAFSSLLILLKNPLLVWDCGFLLSFGSVMGIGILLPVFDFLLPFDNRLLAALKASLSVSVFTFPITLQFFGRYPLYSVLLNLLFIPLMTVLFLGGCVTLFAGLVSIKAGMLVSVLPCFILQIYDKGNRVYGVLPYGNLNLGTPQGWQTALFYFLVLAAGAAAARGRKGTKRRRLCAMRTAVAFCLAAAVFMAGVRIRPQFEITVLDVGQGDCNYIRSGDFHCLIDGGSTSVSQVGKYRIEPFLRARGVSRLDAVFLSHMDADHINGVEELMESSLDAIEIGCIMTPPIGDGDEAYDALKDKAGEAGIALVQMRRGDRITHGSLQITCLYPTGVVLPEDDKNENSLVLRVETAGFRGLFTGDLEGRGEERLLSLAGDGEYLLLKAGHHGSRGGTGEAFLKKVSPLVVTVSCGRDNSYGHPHQEFMQRVSKTADKVYITYESGAVTFVGKGTKGMEIECFRERKND